MNHCFSEYTAKGCKTQSFLSDHLLQAVVAIQDKCLYLLILWLIPSICLILPSSKLALPCQLLEGSNPHTQGMRWHSAYRHRRALALGFAVSLHYPLLLALQLMDIPTEKELTRSRCCWLEALCASVPATWWQECGEVTRTLWSRYASCVRVCILL